MKITLGGIIYLHSNYHNRMAGTLFPLDLRGELVVKRVVMVTTISDRVCLVMGEQRETQLLNKRTMEDTTSVARLDDMAPSDHRHYSLPILVGSYRSAARTRRRGNQAPAGAMLYRLVKCPCSTTVSG